MGVSSKEPPLTIFQSQSIQQMEAVIETVLVRHHSFEKTSQFGRQYKIKHFQHTSTQESFLLLRIALGQQPLRIRTFINNTVDTIPLIVPPNVCSDNILTAASFFLPRPSVAFLQYGLNGRTYLRLSACSPTTTVYRFKKELLSATVSFTNIRSSACYLNSSMSFYVVKKQRTFYAQIPFIIGVRFPRVSKGRQNFTGQTKKHSSNCYDAHLRFCSKVPLIYTNV